MDAPQSISLSLDTPASARDASDSEAALIERARRDRAAFAELYRCHYAAIGSYLLRRSGDAHATEDMLSETFLAALRGLKRYRGDGAPFRHWLYRIATNVANRWARKHRAQFDALDDPLAVIDERSLGDTDLAVDVRLQRAVLALAPKHQAVLVLHYVEGLSVEQVARVLGCRPGTVKSRMSRARDALAARLQRRGGS
jgi:RNA polymerase sigma-70 factor (ECF subfamily)